MPSNETYLKTSLDDVRRWLHQHGWTEFEFRLRCINGWWQLTAVRTAFGVTYHTYYLGQGRNIEDAIKDAPSITDGSSPR